MVSALSEYQKVPVVEYENSVCEKPLVSVIVQTYNHEKFIAQCLDSILEQKTDFDFEILVGEDESSDKTREICLKYAEKYSNKIRLFLHKRQNVIHVDGKPTGRFNFVWNISHSQGKYIAVCEGDDYWIEPQKLQKQVDFLEKNKDFAICFHPVKLLKNDSNKLIERDNTKKVRSVTTIIDLAKSNYIHTPTVVFRNENLDLEIFAKSEIPAGDYLLHLQNAKYGKIKKLRHKMAVYRIHGGGVWSGLNFYITNEKWLNILDKLIELEFEKDVIDNLKWQYQHVLSQLIHKSFKEKNENIINYLKLYFDKKYYSKDEDLISFILKYKSNLQRLFFFKNRFWNK